MRWFSTPTQFTDNYISLQVLSLTVLALEILLLAELQSLSLIVKANLHSAQRKRLGSSSTRLQSNAKLVAVHNLRVFMPWKRIFPVLSPYQGEHRDFFPSHCMI
jgi:hypothetical protein